MAEADSEKPASGQGVGLWSFVGRIFDTTPVTRILLVVGIALLVCFALGGIPKIQVFTPSVSRNVLVLGVLAIASSIAMKVVRPGRFTGKFGEFHGIFGFIMLATGLFTIAIVVLSYFGVLALPKSDSLRAGLDEVVIGLALASWCGFIPAYLSARHLQTIPSEINSQIDVLTKKIDGELERLKDSETKLVNHIEDATRAMLKGFDEVFARALLMIAEAQDELIIVNFAMNFGSPHRHNPEVVRKYAERNGAVFSKDVNTFFSQLKGKVASLPSVQILTVSDKGAFNNFLTPLSQRAGYEALQQAFSTEQAAGNKTRAEIAEMISRESIDCTDGRAPKCMLEVERLPIQLLIAGLPRRGGSPRTGCLVFMVGTEMLQSGLDTGSEPAFYTELDNMVVVFRRLAHSLMEAARVSSRQAGGRG